jgi:predicted transcriptional regulator
MSSVRVSDETKNRLEELASEDYSMDEIIRMLLADYYDEDFEFDDDEDD